MRLFPRRRNQVMSCAEVGKLLQHYLDDELDPARAGKIAEHLEDCRRCGLEADTYERIKLSLATHNPALEHDPVLKRLRAFADGLVDIDRETNE